MRVVVWIAVLMSLAAFACSARPLPHHPQPEDGRRAELRRAALALLTAVSDRDSSRVAAYFAPEWQIATPGVFQSLTPSDAPAWLSTNLHDPMGASVRLERVLLPGAPFVATPYDLKHTAGAQSDPFSSYTRKLDKGKVVTILAFPTDDPGVRPSPPPLALTWEKGPTGWVVSRAEWLSPLPSSTPGPPPQPSEE